MKSILITGINSYIGTSLKTYLSKTDDDYKVNMISLRDNAWKENDFSNYDVLCHVVGVAHIIETRANKELYFKINRDLAYEVARKAKADGVKQFLFLSTMSVYGIETGTINNDTPLQPKSAYGKSKLEAENLIKTLRDDSFVVTIVRPPMVYGRGCTGNYQKLSSFALKMPLFPNIDNYRSMIYIDNLSDFIKQLIDNQREGLFLPQNAEYVNTSKMVKEIAKVHQKKLVTTKLFNPLIKILKIGIVNKVFGNLIYDSAVANNIEKVTFEDSIKMTERN